MEDELPSVSITMRFLDLCDHYGSQRAIVGLVAAGRKVGVSGLPGHADWPAWDADEMQAAVKYLEEATNRNGGAAGKSTGPAFCDLTHVKRHPELPPRRHRKLTPRRNGVCC